MATLKVVTVVGTRPEVIRLSRVIARLDLHFRHTLVHTGQNFDYELGQQLFEDLGLRTPDFCLEAAGKDLPSAQAIGQILIAVDRVLAEVQPDAFLILGDTNSCLAVIAAKKRRIPSFHLEAGNRCFDQRVPEEVNRRIVDHAADINLTYSSIARDYLVNEGIPPGQVIRIGSPMREVLTFYRQSIEASQVLGRLGLEIGQFFLVSAHREENIGPDVSFAKLIKILNALAEDHGLPVLVSTHPRTRQKLEAVAPEVHPQVRFMKPFGFVDYIKLQQSARAVLSDSGTITEESAILGFPALNLREAHERPEGMEQAVVMMVGLEVDRVRQGLAILESAPRAVESTTSQVPDYDDTNVADKVVRIVLSYTDYVNREIWKKY